MRLKRTKFPNITLMCSYMTSAFKSMDEYVKLYSTLISNFLVYPYKRERRVFKFYFSVLFLSSRCGDLCATVCLYFAPSQ